MGGASVEDLVTAIMKHQESVSDAGYSGVYLRTNVSEGPFIPSLL
jgi:hypothetical protein